MTTPDIVAGDLLVIGSTSYAIRAVETWPWTGPTASFARLATVTASTQRTPAIASGKVGTPTTHLASVSCLPLTPVDMELRQRLQLNTPYVLWQTFVQGTAAGDSALRLVLEEKR